MLSDFLLGLGIYTILYFLYENLRTPAKLLYNSWLQRHKPQHEHLMEKYGKWAAVTGSTDGIGKAYARELARMGFNIVVIANVDTKEVANEIATEFKVETFAIECDFSKGSEIYASLFNKLSEKPIGIMVNNVGVAHNPIGTINNISEKCIWDMININIGAATQLSRHFIDKWQKSGQIGLIVNNASLASLQPTPFGAVYGAGKAYIRNFTQALQAETKHLGISVQLMSPSFVATKINSFSEKIKNGNLLVPQPDQFAKWAVGTLGKVDETTGYFWHGVYATILNILPYRLRITLILWAARFISDDLAEAKDLRDKNKIKGN